MSSATILSMTTSFKTTKKLERNANRFKDTMETDGLDINSLLNFRLPPRKTINPLSLRNRGSHRRGPSRSVWNKEKFVNAQYRFVMSPTGDYAAHFADPDIFFQWKDIVEVIIPRQPSLDCQPYIGPALGNDCANYNCPICLSPPVAPRLTKCGHIFCYPCFLHYLSTTARKWAKCPICHDIITESQLKPVRWFDQAINTTSVSPSFQNDVRPDPIISMRLILRPQLTTLALPVSSTWPSVVLPLLRAPFHFLPDVERFAKFMIATPEYLSTHLREDLENLTAEGKIREDLKDTIGAGFVEDSKCRILDQMEHSELYNTSKLQEDVEDIQRLLFQISNGPANGSSGENRVDSLDVNQALGSRVPGLSSKKTFSQSRINRRNINPPSDSSSYYFYMAANGRQVFLHPLDIRILLAKYSSYSQFPPRIDVLVEASVESTVDADLRKRCKYLSHLPEGSDVVFIEADLEINVGREVLQPFEAALRQRRNRRLEKDRKEERAKMKAEELARRREREIGIAGGIDHTGFQSQVGPVTEANEESEFPIMSYEPISSTTGGAWGSRSFATAANAGAQGGEQVRVGLDQEDYESHSFEVAWQGLEERVTQRKGKNRQLVILGGGGRRHR